MLKYCDKDGIEKTIIDNENINDYVSGSGKGLSTFFHDNDLRIFNDNGDIEIGESSDVNTHVTRITNDCNMAFELTVNGDMGVGGNIGIEGDMSVSGEIDQIGPLANLTTDAKNNLVSAINEVYNMDKELVIGASTIRKGTFTFVPRANSQFCDATVTFTTPMPDADYEVTISWVTETGISMYGRVQKKTANGFNFEGYYSNEIDRNIYGNQEVAYTAFKLFTKEGLEDLENDVSALKTKTQYADVVQSGNMKAVTSNAVYDTLVNTTIIQSNVKRTETRDPTGSSWFAASLQKPTIPAGKRLVRWLAFIDISDLAVSVGSRGGGIDNCILVHGDSDLPTTPITFTIWWGAEIADL